MAKVYLLQDIPVDSETGRPKYNIMGARKYGDIVIMFRALEQIMLSPGPFIFSIRQKLKDFTENDYLYFYSSKIDPSLSIEVSKRGEKVCFISSFSSKRHILRYSDIKNACGEDITGYEISIPQIKSSFFISSMLKKPKELNRKCIDKIIIYPLINEYAYNKIVTPYPYHNNYQDALLSLEQPFLDLRFDETRDDSIALQNFLDKSIHYGFKEISNYKVVADLAMPGINFDCLKRVIFPPHFEYYSNFLKEELLKLPDNQVKFLFLGPNHFERLYKVDTKNITITNKRSKKSPFNLTPFGDQDTHNVKINKISCSFATKNLDLRDAKFEIISFNDFIDSTKTENSQNIYQCNNKYFPILSLNNQKNAMQFTSSIYLYDRDLLTKELLSELYSFMD